MKAGQFCHIVFGNTVKVEKVLNRSKTAYFVSCFLLETCGSTFILENAEYIIPIDLRKINYY